jgi:hypothetical protein
MECPERETDLSKKVTNQDKIDACRAQNVQKLESLLVEINKAQLLSAEEPPGMKGQSPRFLKISELQPHIAPLVDAIKYIKVLTNDEKLQMKTAIGDDVPGWLRLGEILPEETAFGRSRRVKSRESFVKLYCRKKNCSKNRALKKYARALQLFM